MKRCTFPAGCTDDGEYVDAYGHEVCERHAPFGTLTRRQALPGELAVTGVDREQGVITIGVKQ